MQYFSNSKPMLIDDNFKKGIEYNFIKQDNMIQNKNDSSLLNDIINMIFFFINENVLPHILFIVMLILIILFFYYRYKNKGKFKKEYSNDEKRILNYLEYEVVDKKELENKSLKNENTLLKHNIDNEYSNLNKMKMSEYNSLNKEYINIQDKYRDLYEIRNKKEDLHNYYNDYTDIWNQNSRDDLGDYTLNYKKNKIKGILKKKNNTDDLNVMAPYA
jgi:hypothetical protein